MKKQFVIGLAVLLLSGCVYYVPYEVAATEPWTDESVAYEEPGAVYDTYVVSPYYPWASVDYFYLGNNYYRPYSGAFYSFGFYGGGGWYPPYYDPYYYYAAWYPPFYYPYPYYGAGYGWGYGYSYWNHHDSHHGDGNWGDDGGHDGGYGGQGGGHYGSGSGDGHRGNTGGTSARTGGGSSLDRHVQVRRQPGQFDRNGPATPSADGRGPGVTAVNRSDNKPQPNRLQPVGTMGHQDGSKPVVPADRSGVAIPPGQVRTVQPPRGNAVPARMSMPSGISRQVPAENSGGKQYVLQQQAPPESANQSPSAPSPQSGPSPSAPSFNQQMAPQPARPAPSGGYERGPRRADTDGN